jgi:hypothetical protein
MISEFIDFMDFLSSTSSIKIQHSTEVVMW